MKKLLTTLFILCAVTVSAQSFSYYIDKYKLYKYDNNLKDWSLIKEEEQYSEFRLPENGSCFYQITASETLRLCITESSKINNSEDMMYTVKTDDDMYFNLFVGTKKLGFMFLKNGNSYLIEYRIYNYKTY